MCGSFFRNYLAPVARRFEEVSLEAALAAAPRNEADRATLKKNAVFDTWRTAMQRGLENSITAEAGEIEESYSEAESAGGGPTSQYSSLSSPHSKAQVLLPGGARLRSEPQDEPKLEADTQVVQRSIKRAKNANGKAVFPAEAVSEPLLASRARARKDKSAGLSPAQAAARAAALAALEDSPSDSDSNAGDATEQQAHAHAHVEHGEVEDEDEDEEGEVERRVCGGTSGESGATKRSLEEGGEELKACKKRKEDSQFFRRASPAVQRWLKPPKVCAQVPVYPCNLPAIAVLAVLTASSRSPIVPVPPLCRLSQIAKEGKERKREAFGEFSDAVPPVVLDRATIDKAIRHLSANDPKMARLISRVGADALAANVGDVLPPDEVRLFDVLLKSITFSMISVEAGNAILRKLARQVRLDPVPLSWIEIGPDLEWQEHRDFTKLKGSSRLSPSPSPSPRPPSDHLRLDHPLICRHFGFQPALPRSILLPDQHTCHHFNHRSNEALMKL